MQDKTELLAAAGLSMPINGHLNAPWPLRELPKELLSRDQCSILIKLILCTGLVLERKGQDEPARSQPPRSCPTERKQGEGASPLPYTWVKSVIHTLEGFSSRMKHNLEDACREAGTQKSWHAEL